MSTTIFRFILITLAAGFAMAFAVIVVPPLIQSKDIIGAFAAGFVNPFSSGYALDAIICWLVLTAWVIYEAKAEGIKHGWVAVILGAVPGVATGLAVYLLLRMKQQDSKNHPHG